MKSLHLNLDRRTGFAKVGSTATTPTAVCPEEESLTHSVVRSVLQGYALIEYEERKEAEDAISSMNNQEFLTRTVKVDWAFRKGP